MPIEEARQFAPAIDAICPMTTQPPIPPENAPHLEKIGLHLNRARPLAEDRFPNKLETKPTRRLCPRPVGRPIKKKADKPATEKRQK
jgi:hypothetical protein